MATPAASSEAELIRFPYDKRAMDVSMSLLDLLAAMAAMAAFKAALFVAIASAKPENFPCYSSRFRSFVLSVVVTRQAIYSLRT
jgi:hypothetical protein